MCLLALHQIYGFEEKNCFYCNSTITKNQTQIFENSDPTKLLLTRSSYILAKKDYTWTLSQKERVTFLFTQYPMLKTAYHEVLAFRNIFEEQNKDKAQIKLEN